METKEQTRQKVYGVYRDGVLTRTVQFKKHYFWKYHGYSFGVDFLQSVEKQHGRIDTLVIHEQDTGKVFRISYNDFMLLSDVVYTNYGKQRVINLDHCEKAQDNGADKREKIAGKN